LDFDYRMPSRQKLNAKDQSSKTEDQIAAILLAAGRSRRMGAFKPLLPFGEQTVIESCVRNLQAAGVDEIVVVIGYRAEDLQSQLKNLNLSYAINPDPDSEMSASIGIGTARISPRARAVLIALVDHPAVPPSVITQLIDEWRKQGGAQLFQPEYHGRGGHPVLIDLKLRTEMINLDPRRGLRALFDLHRAEVCRIAVDSPFVARDMDTWEDYRQLHRDVFGQAPPEP
jgi:molybdenum cofactor cytidylyltransferase